MPKLTFTKKIYFRITRGKNQAFSKSEALGRLYSCGFEIVAEMYHDENFYFIVKKVKEPVEKNDKNYGLIIRLKRIGQSGKLFNVYKFRTMHPYSEYIQEYIYNNNSLQEGGKFKDDFRITRLGHFMRKFWIDEFPMFINLFKGNMKLVGVRPLSEQYLSLYRKELREKRLKYKPGLFPPFYADLPRTLDEIMDSEMKYLERYEKSPYYTDFIYLFKALYNIFIKKARSK
jgi:lipopolysaccharide/colanic/teichoic acid biosynthesis glycosyltransferase